MKRVCFLLTSLESGGAENYLLRFLQYTGNRIQPYILCKSGRKGVLEKQYKAANAIIITLPPGYFNIKAWQTAYYLFKKNKIEAVCDFTGNFAGIYLAVAKWAGVKKRIAFYRRSSQAFKVSKANLLYDKTVNKLVSLYATKILANSLHGLNFFHPSRRSNDSRFEVIPNGIDSTNFVSKIPKEEIRKELNIPTGAFVVGHTGRLNEAKNHVTLIKIAENLVEKDDNLYFLFCGKNTNKLLQQIHSERLKKRLILLGYRSDVNRVLKAIDLFIFPSITEGQPNALIEAMVTGVPFLASNIEPIKEVVPKEAAHQLLNPFDINGFSCAINKIYNDTGLLKEFSCKEYAMKKFDAKTNFNKFLQLI